MDLWVSMVFLHVNSTNSAHNHYTSVSEGIEEQDEIVQGLYSACSPSACTCCGSSKILAFVIEN